MRLPFAKPKAPPTPDHDGTTAASANPPPISESSASVDLDEKKDLETEKPSTLARIATGASHASGIQTTAIQEAGALDKLSDEPEYPSGPKLAIITTALCFSVFCMALVWPPPSDR